MDRVSRGDFPPRVLQEMRNASRSPNKRSVSGTRCCDEQEEKQEEPSQQERETPVISARSGPSGVLAVSATVTPFKRFRADSLISPPSKGTTVTGTAAASGARGLLARRRAQPAFQSLASDHASRSTPVMHMKTESEIDADVSTQDSSQSTQLSSQGGSAIVKALECSPADVAELCTQLLVCSETLEDQMDALDVGSFLSWRPTVSPLLLQADRTPQLVHRQKPRIRFGDDASYEIGLEEVFDDETQLEDPLPLAFLPSLPVAYFPLSDDNGDDDGDGCCMCADGHEHEHENVERYWQVYSPPPHAGFDPKSCSPEWDLELDVDTENESPFDSL